VTESLILDRRFRQVGRIKRASGTNHKPTFRRINEMLTGLFERGRLDLLRSVQDGTLTPMQVYDAYRLNELHRLPTAAMMAPLKETMEKWIAGYECSESHRLSLAQSLRHLRAVRGNATVGDLPALLSVFRVKMQGTHPRTFNIARSAAQAFVRSTMKRTHPLWMELSGIEVLKVRAQKAKHPVTPKELAAITTMELPIHYHTIIWGMASTGMGPSEFWGRWEMKADRFLIHGTKRKGRERIVPRFTTVFRPTIKYPAFRKALAAISDLTPYDLRRSYANWLESAGIPRNRRRQYLGHAAGDVTDLYEWHEVEKYLAEDGEKLHNYVFGATDKPTLKLEKKA